MTELKDYCLTCGNGPLHPDGIHSCYEHPVIAHLKARIAELEEALSLVDAWFKFEQRLDMCVQADDAVKAALGKAKEEK